MIRVTGWAVLFLDKSNNKMYNVWINVHDCGDLANFNVILAMDVFEHAYINDAIDRKIYVEKFLKHANWYVCSQSLIKLFLAIKKNQVF